jgi:hypothetical protein
VSACGLSKTLARDVLIGQMRGIIGGVIIHENQ